MLANGDICGDNPGAPSPGWAADGANGCLWTLTGSSHDIAFYLIL